MMVIMYYETVPVNTARFNGKHWLHTRTVDGKELIIISGVVDIKGSGSDWYRDTLRLGIDRNSALGTNILREKGIEL